MRFHFCQREHAELVASMQSLRPTNQFQQDMTDVAFPRQFPIDNETAKKYVYTTTHNKLLCYCVVCHVLLVYYVYSEEEGVGFEDHVLLNHLLKGFPSRGAFLRCEFNTTV